MHLNMPIHFVWCFLFLYKEIRCSYMHKMFVTSQSVHVVSTHFNVYFILMDYKELKCVL
jgi:hypothetical protein